MATDPDSWFQKAFNVGKDAFDSVEKKAAEAEAVAAQKLREAAQKAREAREFAAQKAAEAKAFVTQKAKDAAGVGGPKGPPPPAAKSNAGPSPAGSGAISGSVGRGGKNQPDDVKFVQRALGLSEDGKCGPQTIGAIEKFQRSLRQAKPDGRIDPGGPTLRALMSGGKAASAPASAPPTPAKGDEDSGSLLGRLAKGAEDLAGEAKALGGRIVRGAEELADDARDLGGKILKGAGNLSGAPGSPLGSLPSGALAASAGAGGSSGIDRKFHGEFPERKLYEFGKTAKVKGAIKLQGEMTIELVEKGTTNPIKAGATGNKGFKGEIELGKQKGSELLEKFKIDEVKELLNIEGSKKRVKLSVSIEVKFKPFIEGKGRVVSGSLAGVATAELKVAEVEWEELKKSPDNFTVAGGEIAGGLQGDVIVPLKASDATISIKGVCSGSVEPNWPVIFAEAAKKGIESALEQGAVILGADVIITGSFIVGGIATIAGACYQIAFGLALKDMTESYAANLRNMEAGFRAGMSGGASPSDRYGKAGYELGQGNFKKLVERTKQQNPQATDAAVRSAVLPKADEATREAINSGEVASALKNGMWDGLLADGKWLFTAKDAATAFQACGLGNDPRFDAKAANTPQWKKYLAQYPLQSKL